MHAELLLLRLIHILGGVFWLGSGVFTTLFLAPALATPGVNAGRVFAALQQRRLFTVVPLVAVLTIASGLRLIWIDSGGLDARYFASATGATLGGSGAAAMVAFFLSLAIARPSAARAGRLEASLATAPEASRAGLASEITALRRRGVVAGNIAMLLLIAGGAGMAVARYLA
ncbi:MAG: hypothetical protein ACYC3L_12950 [Gemmatimonadaceae bacterium]